MWLLYYGVKEFNLGYHNPGRFVVGIMGFLLWYLKLDPLTSPEGLIVGLFCVDYLRFRVEGGFRV